MRGSLALFCDLAPGKHIGLYHIQNSGDQRLGSQRDPFGSTTLPDLSEIEALCQEEPEDQKEADQVDALAGYSLCKLRDIFRSRVLEWAALPAQEVHQKSQQTLGAGDVQTRLRANQASQSSSARSQSQSPSAQARSQTQSPSAQARSQSQSASAQRQPQSASAQSQPQGKEKKEQKGATSGSSKSSASQAADFQIAYTKYDMKATGNDRTVEMKTTPWF